MKTLLVLAAQAGLADAIRAIVDPQRYRVVYQREHWEAEPMLAHGTIDAVILDAQLTSIQPIRCIELVRRRVPQCPVFLFTSTKEWEWEEEAYLLGVQQVLMKPVRGRLFNLLLDRCWSTAHAPAAKVAPARPPTIPWPSENPHRAAEQSLSVLRDFSTILSHSLCAEALLRQFLLLIREILGVNRAAIFLRQPPGSLSDPPNSSDAHRLRSSCAIGLPPGLLGHFDLTLDAGIGAYLYRRGRILVRDSVEVEQDLEMQKEFELLGAQVAVPILDRETLVGVAVFDKRVTGEPLVNGELELIFHLLERLGLSIKNIWLHDQLTASHAILTDILRQLQSACLVVGRDLSILHANQAAQDFFGRSPRSDSPLEFGDLPQVLGSKVFEVLKTGVPVRRFDYTILEPQKRVYQVAVTPFSKKGAIAPNAALVLVEDSTDADQLHSLELEAARLRVIKTMAERLSHEVGNAVVPLSTHQQLFDEKSDDREFLDSLKTALEHGVKRVSRLASQMLFLARDLPSRTDAVPLEQLLREALEEAAKHERGPSPHISYENGQRPVVLSGDQVGLRHALAELLLNALQANPTEPRISVRTREHKDEFGHPWVDIEIADNGGGFAPEVAEKAVQPFYTTRNVGLGLGLTVSLKIIQTHSGRLEIEDTTKSKSGLVRVSLPLLEN